MKDLLQLSDEVRKALDSGQPVVALESTVIAHGLPFPHNLECALTLESIIRQQDAVPATIAVLGGVPRIGLSEDEIRHLAQSDNVVKAGTRDLARVIAFKEDGATTVSATAHIAKLAGIKVFVTGGIGGVHRGAEINWDVSSDLWELSQTPIIVVCAGAKAILDLPATLEWLETHQVPVFGLGTDEFPAFYSRKSGLTVSHLESAVDAARVFAVHRHIGSGGGILVTVPIPVEDEIDITDAIEEAVDDARRAGKSGPEVTPWILSRVEQLTQGRSVQANISLLKNNAAAGAKIARALAVMRIEEVH